MIHSVALVILKMVLVCLALSVVALLVALLIPLKVAVQEFIKEFGLKKTVAVAIMALILLPIATAHAGDTIARIEDGNLVYYEKTKVIPGIVPSGITAEQARQLVDGVIPVVSFSKGENMFYLGLPFTSKTDTFVSFRNGWIEDKKVGKSLAVLPLILLSILIVFGFVTGYEGVPARLVIITTLTLVLLLGAVFSGDNVLLQTAGTITIWLLGGTFLGRCLRKVKEKR